MSLSRLLPFWFLVLIPSFSNAFEVEAYLTSTHTERDKYWNQEGTEQREFNDKNYGLGLKLPINRHWSTVTGYYKNSYHNNSAFAGIDYGKSQKVKWQRNTQWFYGARALAVTGYDDTPMESGYLMPSGFVYTGLQIDDSKFTIGTNSSAVLLFISLDFGP